MKRGAFGMLPSPVAHVIVNGIAASPVVPKRVRRRLYRWCGMRIETREVGAGAYFSGSRIEIGRRTYVNVQCYFESTTASIVIGDDCALAMGVMIITSTHEVGPPEHRAGERSRLPVTIEDGSWLGARVTVLPGVTIAAGCIIAAGAVVAADTEPHGLYAGVPAVRVKDLPQA